MAASALCILRTPRRPEALSLFDTKMQSQEVGLARRSLYWPGMGEPGTHAADVEAASCSQALCNARPGPDL